MTMTPEQYAAQCGLRCPNCKSAALSGDGGGFGFKAGGVCLRVSCNDCGAEWEDQYKLTGYEHLEVPA